MNDQQFSQLLSRFGFSWDGYRKVRRGVKKRISRHMGEMGCRTIEAYFLVLEKDEDARQHFERLMTVSISRFFRDRGLWQALEDKVLPAIIKEKGSSVKVWSAGCGCGEEVYSLKILWDNVSKSFQPVPELEVLATDMNPVYLNKADAGVYPRSSLKEVRESLRVSYFKPRGKGKRFAVDESLKEGIVWLEHNLLSGAPGAEFQIVFLRNNLLTYYEDRLKEPAFQKVIDSLSEKGFLIIGSHEKIPIGARELSIVYHHPCIFQRKV